MSLPKVLVVAGPTASGKSHLAVRLAAENNAVVISADSRQFYREIAIGTARITIEEMHGVPHFLVGHFSVYEPVTAGMFEHLALAIIQEQHQLGKNVVVCGGSGLFLDALITGMDELPPANPAIRHQLQDRLESQGLQDLLVQLQQLDPHFYNQVDRQNPRRILRALEVCLSTGKPYSIQREKNPVKRPFSPIWIAPDWSRAELYERINQRVDGMIEQGLEDEVRTWSHALHLDAFNTIGYREWIPFFEGQASKEAVIEKIKQNTRRLAKRQLTYWRRNLNIQWIPANELHKFKFSF